MNATISHERLSSASVERRTFRSAGVSAIAACIGAAHVGSDRLLGYGLKYGASFGDPHPGRRGRRHPL